MDANLPTENRLDLEQAEIVANRLLEYGKGNSRGQLEHLAAAIILQQRAYIIWLMHERDTLAKAGGAAMRELYEHSASKAL